MAYTTAQLGWSERDPDWLRTQAGALDKGILTDSDVLEQLARRQLVHGIGVASLEALRVYQSATMSDWNTRKAARERLDAALNAHREFRFDYEDEVATRTVFETGLEEFMCCWEERTQLRIASVQAMHLRLGQGSWLGKLHVETLRFILDMALPVQDAAKGGFPNHVHTRCCVPLYPACSFLAGTASGGGGGVAGAGAGPSAGGGPPPGSAGGPPSAAARAAVPGGSGAGGRAGRAGKRPRTAGPQ